MAENQSILNYSNIIGEDGTFETLFRYIDELEKRLTNLAKKTKDDLNIINPNDAEAIKKATKEVEGYERGLGELNKQRKVAIAQRKKLQDLTDEELIQREKEKIANRERVQRAKQLAIISREEKNNIASLRAQLSLTTLEWKRLTEEEAENTAEGKRLVAQKLKLTDTLKRLEKQTGDTRRNVGNYTSALDKMGKVAKRVFLGRDIAGAIMRIGGALADIVENGKGASEGLQGISDSTDKLLNILTGATARALEKLAPLIIEVVDYFSYLVEKSIEFGDYFSSAVDTSVNSLGVFGETFKKVGGFLKYYFFDLFFDLPAIFGGIVAAGKQLATNISSNFQQLGLRLQILFANIDKVNPFSDKTQGEINRNIANLKNQIDGLNQSQMGVIDAFKQGFADVKTEQEEYSMRQSDIEKLGERIRNNQEASTNEIAKQNDLLSTQKTRIQAIESLQSDLNQASAENIKDVEEQAQRLEELRYDAVVKERKKNLADLLMVVAKEEELLGVTLAEERKRINDLNHQLEIEQLKEFERNKAKIAEDAALKRKEESNKRLKEGSDELDKIFEEQDKAESERIKASEAKELERLSNITAAQKAAAAEAKEIQEQLFADIAATSAKVAELISKNFEKQTEAATKAVEGQLEAVESQRDRANAGLSNTLKFEQEELAKRQSEELQAQKKQRQAAEILALYNLVAAYAASGDKNALQRGLVDVAALKAIGGLTGFYEGTEHVDSALGGQQAFNSKRDAYLGITKSGKQFRFDGSERIVNGSQNALLGGMSNDDLVRNALLGSHLTDFAPMVDAQHLKKQGSDLQKIKSNPIDGRALGELQAIRRAIQKQGGNSFEIEDVTDMAIKISKKVVNGNMKRTEKIKKRL